MNKRICVIEDNSIDFFLLKKLIAHYVGTEMVVSEYFPSALKALEAAQAGKLTECVVLLDLDLPVLSGWSFLDEFSKIEPSALVFILTVSLNYSDLQRANSYPIVKGFFSKPLTESHLLQIAEATGFINRPSTS